MTSSKIHKQAGFTLIELLVAMAVFTFMLTIITVGFLGVVRSHRSGVVQRNTQQNARLALDQVTKAIQQSASSGMVADLTPTPSLDLLCLTTTGGSHLALEVKAVVVGSFTINTLTIGSIPPGACVSASTYTRLTDNNVTVTQLKVTEFAPVLASQGAVSVTLSVASAYGIPYLDTAQTGCIPGSGSEFCSVVTMDTTSVLKGGTN